MSAVALIAAVGLIVLHVAAWRGHLLVNETEADSARPAPTLVSAPVKEAEKPPGSNAGVVTTGSETDDATAEKEATLRRTLSEAPQAPATQTLLVTANRGDSWVSVRRGSADGPVLYEGVLTLGDAISFEGERFFVRLGGATNVELRYAGRRVAAGLQGTVDVQIPVTTDSERP